MSVVVRIAVFLIFLEIFLRARGLVSLSLQNYQNISNLKDRQAYRIMCIGESTTFAGGKDSYPSQLGRILNERGPARPFEVINRGVPGSNSADIAARLTNDIESYKPGMVIAMIGINDTANTAVYKEQQPMKLNFYIGDLRVLRVFKFLWAHVQKETEDLTDRLPVKEETPVVEKLQREVRRHPKESGAYIELGQHLIEEGRCPEAEELFRRAIRINPRKDWGYDQLSEVLVLQQRYREAEDALEGSVRQNPKKGWAYVSLSHFYGDQHRGPEAEKILKQGLEKNPQDAALYIELSAFYRRQGRSGEAEGLLKQALSFDGGNPQIYIQLGYSYGEQKRYDEMEGVFEKAAVVEARAAAQKKSSDRGEGAVFLDLADWYVKHKEFTRAERLLKTVLSAHPGNARMARGLANIYAQMGLPELSGVCRRRAEALAVQKPLATTANNYRKIVQIVRQRGIAMVSASYATRDAAPLEEMLKGLQGVTFIDNGAVFKEELAKGKYEDYFTDAFAGDFGHCTAKGDRILAENIARNLPLN